MAVLALLDAYRSLVNVMRIRSASAPRKIWVTVAFVLMLASPYASANTGMKVAGEAILLLLGAVAATALGIKANEKAKHASDTYCVWFGTDRVELPGSRDYFLQLMTRISIMDTRNAPARCSRRAGRS